MIMENRAGNDNRRFSWKRLYLKTIGQWLPTDLFARRFPVSVKGVCRIDGKIILVQNEHRRWDLPGGKLKYNECLEECLVREMQEEIGIQVRVNGLLGVVQIRIRTWLPVIVPVYACETSESVDLIRHSNENFGVGLFDIEEIRKMPFPGEYVSLLSGLPTAAGKSALEFR